MMWVLGAIGLIILTFGFVVFRGAPYVPTKRGELRDMFDTVYPLGKHDMLVDIGSGDGVVLREAARRGARALGYELNPILVVLSQWLSRRDARVQIKLADFWQVKLPKETTVVYTFGESRDIAKMMRKVTSEADRLRKPLVFISYGFAVPHETPLKRHGAYYIYEITPLQDKKA